MPRHAITIPALAYLALHAVATMALAHSGNGSHSSFLSGFLHPLAGADHVLAMVTVGAWAALLGGRALVALPASFVAAMLAGYAAALWGFVPAYVEPMILASLVVLGILAATALKIPTALAFAAVMIFGSYHGAAHAGEIGNASVFAYAIGFAISTAVLHGVGVIMCLATDRIVPQRGLLVPVARAVGATAAIGGVLLAVA